MVRVFNKRAQFFGLYLAFITVFLISISLGFYHVQQKNTGSSLVSPKAILDIGDDLQEFERLEKRYILESLKEASFGKDEFKGESHFREEFLKKASNNDFMREFIFSDLVSGEIDLGIEAISESEDFFDFVLYPEENFYLEDGNLVIQRNKVGKSLALFADISEKEEAKNFPIDFKFEFSKKYVVSFSEGEYKLEEV
jgi:hypothetical protein|tara:strand:- start:48 stop:638 length:591 start_codon:yes stop_codon:yes gene_type:complete